MYVGNVKYRFVNLKTKKIILSRHVTWMDTFYGDIHKRKDNTRRYYPKDDTSEDTFIKIETEGES